MKIAVYDTRVTKKCGETMHFDVMVPADMPCEKALEFGKAYLEKIGQSGQPLTSKECKFCHVEPARPDVLESITHHGHFIYEMEGCP